MPPLVSIIIVNFNAGPLLERCLCSIEGQTYRSLEVVVIDNASQDSSLQAAEARDWVRVVKNPVNRGFAAGQNQGMALSRGQYLMPLNFDIHLAPNFLEEAVEVLEPCPRLGSITGKMLRMKADGTLTDEFDNAGLLLPQKRVPLPRGQGEKDTGQYEDRTLVFGAPGAAPVYRRAMLEDVAYRGEYFDESFFTWWEDIDLDWRARLRGWDCLYLPEAVAYHIGDPQKHEPTPFAVRHGLRNRWQMILADDCLHCMARDIRWLVYTEFTLVRHVVKYRLVPAYIQASFEVLGRLPQILRKRFWVRSHLRRSCLPQYPEPFGR